MFFTLRHILGCFSENVQTEYSRLITARFGILNK